MCSGVDTEQYPPKREVRNRGLVDIVQSEVRPVPCQLDRAWAEILGCMVLPGCAFDDIDQLLIIVSSFGAFKMV